MAGWDKDLPDDARTAELLRESIGIAGMLHDDYNVAFCATGLAGVAAREGLPERAARLFGVADALIGKTGAGVSWSALRRLNDRDLAVTREALDPETFEEAWERGRAMTTLEQAVDYAPEGNGVPYEQPVDRGRQVVPGSAHGREGGRGANTRP